MNEQVCRWCGTDLKVEEEVFGGDKLWTGHSCRGTIDAEMSATAEECVQKMIEAQKECQRLLKEFIEGDGGFMPMLHRMYPGIGIHNKEEVK